MSELTEKMCWKLIKKEKDTVNLVGIAIYQKPFSNECYEQRSQNEPPLCEQSDDRNAAWYFLISCLFFTSYEDSYRDLGCLIRGSNEIAFNRLILFLIVRVWNWS